MDRPLPTIVVLGASGLIGQAIATDLMRAGSAVVPIARRFTAAQKNAFAGSAVECPIASLDAQALTCLLACHHADIVVNCIGVLQDSGRERADNVHRRFAARLVEALAEQPETPLLIHLSIPGSAAGDETEFSRTKREAERLIAASSVPFVIVRPGFVVAPTAYGGSALIRALAALPLRLPERESARPFAATDIADIARTIAVIARRWRSGERDWATVWDVMERHPSTVGGVVDAFRLRFGGPNAIGRLPGWLMTIGAKAGDMSAHLGWRPPIRGTALRELRRGVKGDPGPWIAGTGIEPASLEDALARLPATVQERWFGRLYLIKPVILGSLAVFWIASGAIALTVAFPTATSILTSHGFPQGLARGITAITSLGDILVGAAVAIRKTCRLGLLAGIAVSLGYLAAASLIAPGLWVDPLGSLPKIVPVIVLMLTALVILEDR